MDAPAAPGPMPCCVCDAPNGKHCVKCKSRHYCSKACQLVDWKRGHNKACKQLAVNFQDRLLDELMPAKKIKEEPAIVASPAAGSAAVRRAPPVRVTAAAGAPNDDVPDWRGTCAICLDLLPIDLAGQTFYSCCCQKICTACHDKCSEYDERCPLCRAPCPATEADLMNRYQKQAAKGNAEAQMHLGDAYRGGRHSLQKNLKRAVELYKQAAAQGHAQAQNKLGCCYETGVGVKIDYKTAKQSFQRAADQGHPGAQCNLGKMFYHGWGVAQSYDEAVRWWRLAAAQGECDALFHLGGCTLTGKGAAWDIDEALRLYARAAAQGHADAPAAMGMVKMMLAGRRCAHIGVPALIAVAPWWTMRRRR